MLIKPNKNPGWGSGTHAGFTLLEILIALFIFTILSLMLVSALHTVIGAQSGTEKNAERLRHVQIVLLGMSRDIEQAVDRPITNASAKQDPAFMGDPHQFTFTHTGIANPMGTSARSTLQRVQYAGDENLLSRTTWDALDQAPTSKSHTRPLLTDVTEARFEYIDKDGKPHQEWPVEDQSHSPLPRAVRIYLTIKDWGKMSQLYVIPIQINNTQPVPQNQTNQPNSQTSDNQSGQSQHDNPPQ